MNRPVHAPCFSPRLSARLLPVLAGLAVAGPATAQNAHWNTQSGVWSHAPNWFSNFVPTPASSVFIGSMPPAFNAGVTLNVSPTVANLTITDGMSLITDSRSLNVTGDTVVSGSNPVDGGIAHSALIVDSYDGTAFRTDNLTLDDGAILLLRGAFTNVSDTMTMQAGTRTMGNGHIWFGGSGSTFVNNGRLAPGTDEGLTLRQLGAGRFNLDGTTGDGNIWLDYYDAPSGRAGHLTLEGVGLSDAFSGRIDMRRGSRLTMDLDEGWTVDQSGLIDVELSGPSSVPTVIEGSAFTLAGLMNINGLGNFRIDSDGLTIAPSAVVNIPDGGALEVGISGVDSQTVIDGGIFNFAGNSNINFYDDAIIRGGVFNSDLSSYGSVDFFSDTDWDGEVTFNGRVRNFGAASVDGPSVINVGEFMMGDSDTHWSVAAPLVINADSLTYGSINGLEGSMSITGGFLNNLTVNMTGSEDSWRVGGSLTIGGTPGNFPITRVSGSRMVVDGNLNVTTGIARVTSDADFSNSATVSIDSSATLRMQGITTVAPDTVFSGEGWLHNGVGATIRMADDSSLERVGLRNSGDLFVARAAAGRASVDRFESTADAAWTVDIRGMLPGLGHDQLVVTGGSAILGGELIVLLDPAVGGFRPEVGDEFTILQASAGVFGTFVNVPGSVLGSVQYGWEVIYNANSVVLRLDRIVPTPGAIALFGLGGLMIARRRRIS